MNIIPADHLNRLVRAYNLGRELIHTFEPNTQPESLEVAIAVESHRWTWKPDHLRLCLIAESHVYTSLEETKINMKMLPNISLTEPKEFVRLVYCLGYGESGQLTQKPKDNKGTWPYWDLFGGLADTGISPRKSSTPLLSERVFWKIKTLENLMDKGIWLLDASLHAIYAPAWSTYYGSKNRLSPSVAQNLHRIWWDEYGKWIINEYKPEYLWIIGKGLMGIFHNMQIPFQGWSYQPGYQITYGNKIQNQNDLFSIAKYLG